MRPALARSALLAIDESKLGPDSPLRPIIARLKSGTTRSLSRDLEHLMQVRLIDWVHEQEVRQHPVLAWLFAVPNFSGRMGRRTARQGARLKAEGRRPGVPDILFPIRRGDWNGLAIELKAERNTPTKEQKLWLQMLRSQGWLTEVCYSFEWARDLILAYLHGERYEPTYQEL